MFFLLLWPDLTADHMKIALASTPKTNDIASEESIKEFEEAIENKEILEDPDRVYRKLFCSDLLCFSLKYLLPFLSGIVILLIFMH